MFLQVSKGVEMILSHLQADTNPLSLNTGSQSKKSTDVLSGHSSSAHLVADGEKGRQVSSHIPTQKETHRHAHLMFCFVFVLMPRVEKLLHLNSLR